MVQNYEFRIKLLVLCIYSYNYGMENRIIEHYHLVKSQRKITSYLLLTSHPNWGYKKIESGRY